jgi:hypothetical protein
MLSFVRVVFVTASIQVFLFARSGRIELSFGLGELDRMYFFQILPLKNDTYGAALTRSTAGQDVVAACKEGITGAKIRPESWQGCMKAS